MEIVERLKRNLAQTLDIDLQHAIRLVVIVGGYFFIRQIAQRELAKKDLKNKLKDDEDLTAQNNLNNLLEKPEDSSAATTSSSFGWGKKTRQRVKLQEQILEAELQKLQENNQDSDDDKDIEDLLLD